MGESIPYRYRPSTEQPSRTKRFVLEALAGGGTGLVAGIAGIFTGALLNGGDCSSASCAVPVLGAMSLGIVVGTPLGVYGVGRTMDGHGTYWASLLGTALGSAVGLALAVITYDAGVDVLTLASIVVGPVVGAMVGYEISNSRRAPLAEPTASQSPASASFQWTPVLRLTRSGGLMGGLAGWF
jgi:hypothetical protein